MAVPLSGRTRYPAILAGCFASFAVLSGVKLASAEELHADLTFQFVCERQSREEIEGDIEVFLKGQAFKVLNLADVQHRHGYNFLETHMMALDDAGRLVEIVSVPTRKGRRYAFVLNTRPPTNHSVAFEEEALRFASDKLGCESRQIARHENGPEKQPFFDHEVRRFENLFEEAERLNGERRL